MTLPVIGLAGPGRLDSGFGVHIPSDCFWVTMDMTLYHCDEIFFRYHAEVGDQVRIEYKSNQEQDEKCQIEERQLEA